MSSVSHRRKRVHESKKAGGTEPVKRARQLSTVQGNGEFTVEEQGSKEVGLVLACGDGVAGQLGMGEDISDKSKPSLIGGLNSDIVDVIAGGMHSICVTSSRTRLVTFGCNDEGALGRETSEPGTEFLPGYVDLPGKVAQISAGDSHTAALLFDGSVFIWGVFRDSRGPLGLVNTGIEKKPVKLNLDVKITKIASGSNHLVLLGSNGHLYTMGCGEQGQLGRVAQRSTDRDCRMGIDHLLKPDIVKLRKKATFSDIWAGSYCTFAKESEKGHIYTFGLNNYKQLGLDNLNTVFWPVQSKKFNNSQWSKISVGEHHAAAVDSTGKIYVIGRKEYGRLGLGKDCEDADKPTLVPKLAQEPCLDISCGSFATFALSKSGKLYSWGMGSSQLGQGMDEEDISEPELVTGKTLDKYVPLSISAGGQHLIILAKPK